MTASELILKLQNIIDKEGDLKVCDMGFEDIEEIKIRTWTHTNYPYDKPDEKIIMIY